MASQRPSKSARKREAQAIRALADSLVALKPSQLENVVVDDDVREAVRQAQTMPSHGALRRQKQYIARLLREQDVELQQARLEALQADPIREKQRFKRAEQLRDQMLSGSHRDANEDPLPSGVAMTDALRDAIKHYHASNSVHTRKTASRQVFRLIHAQLSQHSVE